MLKLTHLRCLSMDCPIGIEEIPYFSWILTSDERDTLQTAYCVTVKNEQGETVWKKEEKSDKSTFVTYEGAPLQSRTRYTWEVTVNDNYGNSATDSTWFETALLDLDLWQAKWVEVPWEMGERGPIFAQQPPVSLMRKAFCLDKPVVKARAYATCHGIYRMTINGQRPDLREFAPEVTVYKAYLCYQTYDVTALLQSGENVIGFEVGDGWYHGFMSKQRMDHYSPKHAILFQIEVTYADGTSQVIISDEAVKADESPIRHADLYAGECFDANLVQKGWDCPGFDDSTWKTVDILDEPLDNLKAQLGEPVVAINTLKVVSVTPTQEGKFVLDFGQVIAGYVRVKVDLPKGAKLRLDHTEGLDEKGNFFVNNPTADQRIVYISDGQPAVYTPQFSFQGFRYVLVEGLEEINPDDFTAIVLSTQKENVGTFECSNKDINRLYWNTRWSQWANMLSIPTDCPTREKAGWTGDIQVYATTAMLNEEMTPFLTRWLHNVTHGQYDNGVVPIIVPIGGGFIQNEEMMEQQYQLPGEIATAGWADAAVLIPWYMYQMTGNTRILADQYESMKKWCDYVIKVSKERRAPDSTLDDSIEQYLWNTGSHYGEHLIPSYSKDGYGPATFEAIRLSTKYVAPIYSYLSNSTLGKIAEMLGHEEDAKYYSEYAEKVFDAFQKGVISDDGHMPVELMGAYAMPLYYGLVPEKHKDFFAKRLVEILEENGNCLDTGFLGTPVLQDALCRIGREDLAYKVMYQEKAPSWLYEVKHGATSIWESWFALDETGKPFISQLGDYTFTMSLNHYAFGCVDDWMFRYMTGIDKQKPGYKKILIQPKPDETLQWAKRSFRCEYGQIISDWKKEDGQFKLDVEIPCNTTATVVLPNGAEYNVGSGTYHFSCSVQ